MSDSSERRRAHPKSAIVAIAMAIALLTPLVWPTPHAAAQIDDAATGDVNCDANVDVTDALLIAQFSVGARTEVAQCPLADPRTQIVAAHGDLDRSGSTDIVDALLISQCSVGIANLGCPRQIIDLPQPLMTAEAAARTDGFVPITVGDKTYAIAQGGAEIGCVDHRTAQACWSPRPLASDQATTMQVHNATAVGTDIYFLMWHGSTTELPAGDGALRVRCWDTVADQLCPGWVDLPNVGHGTITASTNAVWVFAADRKVYCFRPETFQPCPTYNNGRNTSMGGEPGWGDWSEASAWNGDIATTGRRIYATLANRGQVWLHCWDAAVAEPCVAFHPTLVNDTKLDSTDDDMNGRLFFDRSSDGVAVAICSQGSTVKVDCYHLITGADAIDSERALTGTMNAVGVDRGAMMGVSTYHAASNRQFFVGTPSSSTTACYDFTTAQFCGSSAAYQTDFGDPRPYGYEEVGDCLFGFGQAGVLFAIQPDLTLGCSQHTQTLSEVHRAGSGRWGRLDAYRNDGYTINIQVTDALGKVLLPVDGDYLELGDEPISLSALPDDLDVVFLNTVVTRTPGLVPPDSRDPQILIG